MAGISLAGFIIAVIAMMGTVSLAVMTWKERREHQKLANIIAQRRPVVRNLGTSIQPIGESWRVMIPIINSAESETAVAHEGKITVTFKDNFIKNVDPGPFVISKGGEREHYVVLELNKVPPRYSFLHPQMEVDKYEEPDVRISWAEQTAYQTLTP